MGEEYIGIYLKKIRPSKLFSLYTDVSH